MQRPTLLSIPPPHPACQGSSFHLSEICGRHDLCPNPRKSLSRPSRPAGILEEVFFLCDLIPELRDSSSDKKKKGTSVEQTTRGGGTARILQGLRIPRPLARLLTRVSVKNWEPFARDAATAAHNHTRPQKPTPENANQAPLGALVGEA